MTMGDKMKDDSLLTECELQSIKAKLAELLFLREDGRGGYYLRVRHSSASSAIENNSFQENLKKRRVKNKGKKKPPLQKAIEEICGRTQHDDLDQFKPIQLGGQCILKYRVVFVTDNSSLNECPLCGTRTSTMRKRIEFNKRKLVVLCDECRIAYV